MATEKENARNINFVAKLIELTQDRQLTWRSGEPRDSLKKNTDILDDIVYVSENTYDDKYFSLYQIKQKIDLLSSLS